MNTRTATVLDGDKSADQLFSALRERVAALAARNCVPKIVTILLGNDLASSAYVTRKHQTCKKLGIASEDIRLSDSVDQATLLDLIAQKNADPSVDGVLVQLPLPAGIDAGVIGMAIDPAKDVDGLHPVNMGKLLIGTPDLLPCTPSGILHLLRDYQIALAGQRVAIIGRGMLVGRPLAMLLSLPEVDAQVTVLHSRSGTLMDTLQIADVIISAVGQPELVTASMVRRAATVVGVGISYDSDGQMISDIAEDVAEVAHAVTPRHGSVGALTRAKLMENLITIATRRANSNI